MNTTETSTPVTEETVEAVAALAYHFSKEYGWIFLVLFLD